MMDNLKPKSKRDTKSKHSSKHEKNTAASKRRKLLIICKAILYSFVWFIAWSVIAFGLAMALLMAVVFGLVAPDGVMTPRQANNSVLVVILIVGALFLGTVWLMRKAKSLFYRTSRYVLLVCTVIGLFAGIPMSLLGVWQPDNSASNSTASIDENKPALKRYQYMICTNGSYSGYTDEQMKNPNVGFTSDSEDYCKKSGQGKMLKLAETRDEADEIVKQRQAAGQSSSQTSSQPPLYPVEQSTTQREPSCFDYTIYYDYKSIDSDEYMVGRGKTIQEGAQGKGVRCYKDGELVSDKVVKEAVDNIRISGTKERSRSSSSGNKHSCGYYASLGLAHSTYATGCTP